MWISLLIFLQSLFSEPTEPTVQSASKGYVGIESNLQALVLSRWYKIFPALRNKFDEIQVLDKDNPGR